MYKQFVDFVKDFVKSFGKNEIKLLALLIGIDLIFFLLYALSGLRLIPHNKNYNIIIDGSYPEQYMYFKETMLILIFGILLFRVRIYEYLGWFLLAIYLLLDDAFRLHEELGFIVASILGIEPMFGLRVDDFGEIIVYAISGIIILAIIAWGYISSKNDLARLGTLRFIIVLMLLAIPGIFVDMLVHPVLHSLDSTTLLYDIVRLLFRIAEDGGEMIVISILVVAVAHIAHRLITEQANKTSLETV